VISQSLLIRDSWHCANHSRACRLRSSGVNSATTTLVSRSIQLAQGLLAQMAVCADDQQPLI
jgi:hypothetical protein